MESVSVHYLLLREELVPFRDSEWPHLWHAPNLPCLAENWDAIVSVLVREYLETLRDDCTQTLLALLSVSRATAQAALRLLVCHLASGRYQFAHGLTQPNFVRLLPLCPLQFLDANVEFENSWSVISAKLRERLLLIFSGPLHCADQLHGLPTLGPASNVTRQANVGLDEAESLLANTKADELAQSLKRTKPIASNNTNTNAHVGITSDEKPTSSEDIRATSAESTVLSSTTNNTIAAATTATLTRGGLTVEPDSTLWRLLEETRLGKLEQLHTNQFANSSSFAPSHFKETFSFESFSHVAEQRRRRLSGVRQASLIYTIMTRPNAAFARAYFFQYLLQEEFHPRIVSWKQYETELNSSEFEVENWLLNEKMDNKTYMDENKLNDGSKSWSEFYRCFTASLRRFVLWIGQSRHLYRDVQDYAWKVIERSLEYYPTAFQLQPRDDEDRKSRVTLESNDFLARFLKLRTLGDPPISIKYWIGMLSDCFVCSLSENNLSHLRALAKRISDYRESNQSLLAEIHGNLEWNDEATGGGMQSKSREARIEGRDIVSDGLCYYFESVVPGLFELILFLAVLRADANAILGFEQRMRQFELLSLFCPFVFIRAICHVSRNVCDGLVSESRRVLRIDLKLNPDTTKRYISLAGISFTDRSQYEQGIAAISELQAKLAVANRLMAPYCKRLGMSIFLSESEIDLRDETAWWNEAQVSDVERLEAEAKEKSDRAEVGDEKSDRAPSDDDEMSALDESAFENESVKKKEPRSLREICASLEELSKSTKALTKGLKATLKSRKNADPATKTEPGVPVAGALFAHELKNGIFAGQRPLASVFRDARKDLQQQLTILNLELGRIEEFERSIAPSVQKEKPIPPDMANTNASSSTSVSSSTTANNTNSTSLASQSASSKELLDGENENENEQLDQRPGWLRGSMDLEYGAKAEQKYQYTDDSAYWINSEDEIDGEENEDVDIS